MAHSSKKILCGKMDCKWFCSELFCPWSILGTGSTAYLSPSLRAWERIINRLYSRSRELYSEFLYCVPYTVPVDWPWQCQCIHKPLWCDHQCHILLRTRSLQYIWYPLLLFVLYTKSLRLECTRQDWTTEYCCQNTEGQWQSTVCKRIGAESQRKQCKQLVYRDTVGIQTYRADAVYGFSYFSYCYWWKPHVKRKQN